MQPPLLRLHFGYPPPRAKSDDARKISHVALCPPRCFVALQNGYFLSPQSRFVKCGESVALVVHPIAHSIFGGWYFTSGHKIFLVFLSLTLNTSYYLCNSCKKHYLQIIFLNISLLSCPCMDGMKCSKSGLVASKKECMLTNDIISLPNMTATTD